MLNSNALMYALRLLNMCGKEYTNIIGFHDFANALIKNKVPSTIQNLRTNVNQKKVCTYTIKGEYNHWSFYRVASKNYKNSVIQVEYYDSLGSCLSDTDQYCEKAVYNWYLITKHFDPDVDMCCRRRI